MKTGDYGEKLTTEDRQSIPATVACRCCGGTGRVDLDEVPEDTLKLLRRQPRETSVTSLAQLAGIDPAAMISRLARLEAMGLAAGRTHGHRWLWAATPDVRANAPAGPCPGCQDGTLAPVVTDTARGVVILPCPACGRTTFRPKPGGLASR